MKRNGLTVDDWKARLLTATDTGDLLTSASRRSRYDVDHYGSVAVARMKWTAHQSDVGLKYRIQDVEKARDVLIKYLEVTNEERAALEDMLSKTEHVQDDVRPLLDVLGQCLILRDERSSSETLDDDAQHELLQAKQMLQETILRLQRHLDDGRQKHLQMLMDMGQQLMQSCSKQDASVQVDRAQLALDQRSSDISLKPQARALMPGSLSEESWESQILQLVTTVEEVVGQSRSFREDARLQLIQMQNDVVAQKDSVQYALRKGIHRHELAIESLRWQEDNLSMELSKLETAVGRNEWRRRQAVYLPTKLVQSRLVNRNERPELCHDIAQRSLEMHADSLGSVSQVMDHQLHLSRLMRQQLEEHLASVYQDQNRKKLALELDRRCLEILERFDAQFGRNVPPLFAQRYPHAFSIPFVGETTQSAYRK